MSSAPNTCLNHDSIPFNFRALVDTALDEYTKCIGQDLRNHPLAALINTCESPDSILTIFKEQSRAFDEFRNGNPKLVKWFTPVVNGLYAVSTQTVLSDSVSLVGPTLFLRLGI